MTEYFLTCSYKKKHLKSLLFREIFLELTLVTLIL